MFTLERALSETQVETFPFCLSTLWTWKSLTQPRLHLGFQINPAINNYTARSFNFLPASKLWFINGKSYQTTIDEKRFEFSWVSAWEEHFRELLNRSPPTAGQTSRKPQLTFTSTQTFQLGGKSSQPLINSLKNGKAPGHDYLNVELFKAAPELAATILIPLFTKIWEQEEIPTDWSRGVIIKIPQKGSLSDCNNWRGITLLSVPSKIFCKVITQRITQAVDDILRKEQSGFRKGRGCTDHIFTLWNVLEQCDSLGAF